MVTTKQTKKGAILIFVIVILYQVAVGAFEGYSEVRLEVELENEKIRKESVIMMNKENPGPSAAHYKNSGATLLIVINVEDLAKELNKSYYEVAKPIKEDDFKNTHAEQYIQDYDNIILNEKETYLDGLIGASFERLELKYILKDGTIERSKSINLKTQ